MISKTCCLRAACVCVLCECPPNSPVSNGCRLSANNNVVKRSKHHKVSLCGCVVRRCACIVCVCWGLTSSCFGGNTRRRGVFSFMAKSPLFIIYYEVVQ